MGKRYTWSILSILYIGFIFHNSMTSAIQSSAQSSFVLQELLEALTVLGVESTGITEHVIRKAAHVMEYAVLGLLLYRCLLCYPLIGIMRWQTQALLGMMIPLVDETIQLGNPGRSGQISDVWLDMTGFTCGIILYVVVSLLKGKRKRNVH